MQPEGRLIKYMSGAVRSSKRLRGHPVYQDTLSFWSELLDEARRVLNASGNVARPKLAALVYQLEVELEGFQLATTRLESEHKNGRGQMDEPTAKLCE
jgi:hypothetical protein